MGADVWACAVRVTGETVQRNAAADAATNVLIMFLSL
jgi:hypothetical protein